MYMYTTVNGVQMAAINVAKELVEMLNEYKRAERLYDKETSGKLRGSEEYQDAVSKHTTAHDKMYEYAFELYIQRFFKNHDHLPTPVSRRQLEYWKRQINYWINVRPC